MDLSLNVYVLLTLWSILSCGCSPIRFKRTLCYPCKCRSGSLDCSNSDLFEVPLIINRFATTASILDLSYNNVAELNIKQLFYYPSLNLIDLKNNNPFCETTVCQQDYPQTSRTWIKRGITVLNNCQCAQISTQSIFKTESVSFTSSELTTTDKLLITEVITSSSELTTDKLLTTSQENFISTVSTKKTLSTTKKTKSTKRPKPRPNPPNPFTELNDEETSVFQSRITEFDSTYSDSESTITEFDSTTEYESTLPISDDYDVSTILVNERRFLNENELILVAVLPSIFTMILFTAMMICNCCGCCCHCCENFNRKCKLSRQLISERCCTCSKKKKAASSMDLLTANLNTMSLDDTTSDNSEREIFSITDPAVLDIHRRSISLERDPPPKKETKKDKDKKEKDKKDKDKKEKDKKKKKGS